MHGDWGLVEGGRREGLGVGLIERTCQWIGHSGKNKEVVAEKKRLAARKKRRLARCPTKLGEKGFMHETFSVGFLNGRVGSFNRSLLAADPYWFVLT